MSQVEDNRRHDFFIVDNPVVDQKIDSIDKGRRADAGWTYTILCRLADNKTRQATLTLKYLEQKTGRSKPIVIEALKALKGVGLISVTRNHDENGHQTAPTYTLEKVTRVNDDNSGKRARVNSGGGARVNISPEPELRDLTANKDSKETKTKELSPKGEGEAPSGNGEFKGWEVKEHIRARLNEEGYEHSRPTLQKYVWQANSLYRNGTPPEDLFEAADRVVSEWPRIKLSLDDALRDARNGKAGTVTNLNPPAKPTSATPEQVISWCVINARGDLFSNNETRIRQAMNRHDFTSQETPPWTVEKLLGGTENERWQVLDAINALVRRYLRQEGKASG